MNKDNNWIELKDKANICFVTVYNHGERYVIDVTGFPMEDYEILEKATYICTLLFKGETILKVGERLRKELNELTKKTGEFYDFFSVCSLNLKLFEKIFKYELNITAYNNIPGYAKVLVDLVSKDAVVGYFLPRDPITREFIEFEKQSICLSKLRVETNLKKIAMEFMPRIMGSNVLLREVAPNKLVFKNESLGPGIMRQIAEDIKITILNARKALKKRFNFESAENLPEIEGFKEPFSGDFTLSCPEMTITTSFSYKFIEMNFKEGGKK